MGLTAARASALSVLVFGGRPRDPRRARRGRAGQRSDRHPPDRRHGARRPGAARRPIRTIAAWSGCGATAKGARLLHAGRRRRVAALEAELASLAPPSARRWPPPRRSWSGCCTAPARRPPSARRPRPVTPTAPLPGETGTDDADSIAAPSPRCCWRPRRRRSRSRRSRDRCSRASSSCCRSRSPRRRHRSASAPSITTSPPIPTASAPGARWSASISTSSRAPIR